MTAQATTPRPGQAAQPPPRPQASPPADRPERDPWRPGPPLLALAAGWLATFSWSAMITQPAGFLVPLGMLGLVLALAGSGLRVLRWPAYAVAGTQALVGLLGLNLVFAARWSFLGLVPTKSSLEEVFYVIGNGAATLNAYSAPVAVNPTHTRAFLMACGLCVLFAIDVLAFGLKRPPLVALPILVTLSVPVSILDEGLALPVFVGTALLFLRLLAVEHVDRLWSWGDHPRDVPPPKLGVLWQVAVAAIVVALLAAPLVPVADLLNADRGSGGGGDAANGQFQLTTVNPFVRLRRDLVAQTHTPLLYARTRAAETGYVRTTVLDEFREDEWRPSPRDLPANNDADGSFPSPPGLAPGLGGTTNEWQLQLAPGFGTTWLPLPYPVREVQVSGSWRYDARTLDVAYVGGSTPSRLSYKATAFTPDVTASLLDEASSPPTRLRRAMTEVPQNLPAVVKQTAQQVTKGARTDYQKAVALQDWFRRDGGFRYSLEQRPGSGMDLLADFITTDRIGYCEQFAAAMAAMGRTLGIPSRVVVGFLHGTTEPDGRILYTSDDRHAWPEMYFSGVGWVRFEPTPGQRAGVTPAWTREDINAPRPTTSPSPTSAPTRSADAQRRNLEQQNGAGASSVPWWPAAALVALVLLGAGPGAVRQWQRRRRLAAEDGRGLAEGAWAELRATAIDLGLEWPEQRSPREQARTVAGQVGGAADEDDLAALEGLLVQVERGRYGPETGTVAVASEARESTVATVESWRRVMAEGTEQRRGWRGWRGRVWPLSLVRSVSRRW